MMETTTKFKEAVLEQNLPKGQKPSRATAKMRMEILHKMCATICEKHRRKLDHYEE